MIGGREEPVPKALARALAVILFVSAPAALGEGHVAPEGVAPEAALKMLKKGNDRYATSAVNPRRYRSERPALTRGQKPYAIVLSCADSRVPPEIVFDESLGRLFVIRVAGNVAGPDEVASVEYAAEHAGTRLLVVLGHGSCGGVAAAMGPEDPTPSLASLLKEIRPAVDAARAKGADENHLAAEAVKENVRLQLKNVTGRSEVLRKMVAEGRFATAGAVYDLASGRVEWLAP
jgi:carbonic anhydrase